MNKTSMPHVDFTWNPFTGCSFGCPYCYARKIYERFGRSFAPEIHPERLDQPKRHKTPALIFCGSTGDPADVPYGFLESVRGVMYRTPQHQYLILTKRPDLLPDMLVREMPSNLWLGISATNQDEYERRVSDLLAIVDPPQRIVVSLEPLLAPVDLGEYIQYLSWVIVGAVSPGKPLGESHPEWLQQVIDQCGQYFVPVFYKHSGDKLPAFGSWYQRGELIPRYYNANPMRDALLQAQEIAGVR